MWALHIPWCLSVSSPGCKTSHSLPWVETHSSEGISLLWPTWPGQAIKLLFSEKVKVSVTLSQLTLFDSMDCSPPGSSVHGILQARILEWVAIHFSRWSSQSRDQTHISCIAGRSFTIWATREAPTQNSYLWDLFQCQLTESGFSIKEDSSILQAPSWRSTLAWCHG